MPGTIEFDPTGVAYLDGLLSGEAWDTNSFTYSFPTAAELYGANYGLGETGGFNALNAVQRAAVERVLDSYSHYADLDFTRISENADQSADLRYAESDEPTTAWAYYPTTAREGGDVWFNSASKYFDNPTKGSYGFLTFLHETGHALGLKHAHETMGAFGKMPGDHDSLEYTVMTYRSYAGAGVGGYLNGSGDFPQSLMMDDIRAIQHMYGANFDEVGESHIYKWSPATGELSIDGISQGAPISNRVFMTIWSAGAEVTYDFSDYTSDLTVNLQPGAWSTISKAQLARLDAGNPAAHLAAGNIANAYLVQQDGHDNLIRNAVGGEGDDWFNGNNADNEFTGGKGNDYIDGGAGYNVAVFSGKAAYYSWTRNADDTYTITDVRGAHWDGVDTLKNIQALKFSDGLVQITNEQASYKKMDVEQAVNNILGGGADGAEAALVQDLSEGVESFSITAEQALGRLIVEAAQTTSVATLTYQFFTGKIPTAAGMDFLVSADGPNPNNLNSAYYQGFSLENRYINFAINLGVHGEGKAAFAAEYGQLDLMGAITHAYAEIFGWEPGAAKAKELLFADLDPGQGVYTRADYFEDLGGEGLGAKAAMVGWLLAEAVKADIGAYAKANDAFLVDLADGANFGVDLVGVYGQADVALGG